jgi:hypothetical protein
MANGSYYPGEGIHLKIRFEHGTHVKRIRATFVYEKDEDTKIVLSGIPNEQEDGKWLAILSGRATDKLGSYTAIDLTAEYDGGHTIAFRTPLRDAIFLVKEPSVRPPVLVDDWEWASK